MAKVDKKQIWKKAVEAIKDDLPEINQLIERYSLRKKFSKNAKFQIHDAKGSPYFTPDYSIVRLDDNTSIVTLKQIGSGGHGVVKLAIHLKKENNVWVVDENENNIRALKIQNYFKDTPSSEYQAMLDMEENVAYTTRAKTEDYDKIYLDMPYREGKVLHELFSNEDDVDFEERWEISIKLMEKIEKTHQKNWVHFDVKPDNLIYDKEKNELHLLDYGISKKIQPGEKEVEQANYTPYFVAPEVENKGKGSFKSDVYSAGILIRNIVQPRKFLKNTVFSEELESYFKKMRAEKPDDRPTATDAKEFLIQQLANFQNLLAETLKELNNKIEKITSDLNEAIEKGSLNSDQTALAYAIIGNYDRQAFKISQRLENVKDNPITLNEFKQLYCDSLVILNNKTVAKTFGEKDSFIKGCLNTLTRPLSKLMGKLAANYKWDNYGFFANKIVDSFAKAQQEVVESKHSKIEPKR